MGGMTGEESPTRRDRLPISREDSGKVFYAPAPFNRLGALGARVLGNVLPVGMIVEYQIDVTG